MSNIQRQLNSLANIGSMATVKNASFGWSMLLRYEPLCTSVMMQLNADEGKFRAWLDSCGCHVFEIGKNCGDVFSASMVEKIELTELGAIIHLK